jgi:hypothetical protein
VLCSSILVDIAVGLLADLPEEQIPQTFTPGWIQLMPHFFRILLRFEAV